MTIKPIHECGVLNRGVFDAPARLMYTKAILLCRDDNLETNICVAEPPRAHPDQFCAIPLCLRHHPKGQAGLGQSGLKPFDRSSGYARRRFPGPDPNLLCRNGLN